MLAARFPRLSALVCAVVLWAACAAEPGKEAEADPQAITGGLLAPESVLYDAGQDVYYISNVNGSPFDADDDGFISRAVAGDGNIELRWIDGADEDVQLDAPKGMAIVGEELWVADITRIRRFDRQTGEPRGEIPIQDAGSLDDLATNGRVAWVSDRGLRAGRTGFEPSGTDAIYRIDPTGAIERIATGEALGRPNGIAVDGETVWVVTFGTGELYHLRDGQPTDVTKLPQGGLDGLVLLPDGSFLVSSWDGSAVFRGRPDGTFAAVVENAETPAGIDFDTKRNLIVIPHVDQNQVTFHRVGSPASAAGNARGSDAVGVAR